MTPTTDKDSGVNGINEWTVMVYFGSDGELSPLIVSQLKAIKEAGYQEKTDVLLYFDANEKGAPTRIYNVNQRRKARAAQDKKTEIGDGEDPYVRNLAKDNIAPEDIDTEGKLFSGRLSKSLKSTDTTKALDALRNFINYGRENHRAKHYMLFLVGHGMIVGNDAFLPDEAPRSAITLKELGEALREFSDPMDAGKEAFELLALHSCSMSAVEVAYELKGTAKYMIASEGISFVGSFPYRQLLKKTFKTVKEAQEDAEATGAEPVYDVETLIQKLYFLSLFNSTDFMLSGFSADLSLCNLDPTILRDFGAQLVTLVGELKNGLRDHATRELILLAHLESQSYWNESYTDLYDFCLRLEEGCNSRGNNGLLTLSGACRAVINGLEKDRSNPFSKLVVFSEHFGSKYQYSHGLSVYLPWAEPVEDPNEKIIENYGNYLFTTDFQTESNDDSWLSFLNLYFKKTIRPSRIKEDNPDPAPVGNGLNLVTFAEAAFSNVGALEHKASGAFEGKASGAAGSACSCPSIKNYENFSISPGAALAFSDDSDDPLPERRKRAKRHSPSQGPS
jgi:hypothetical protein